MMQNLLPTSELKKPQITVALSVFNGGGLLEVAVQSIVRQSFVDWELIVIDDGSTDGSLDRLRNISDPRILIIQDGLNKGLSSRLNQAVCMARGKYFTRMDHDDISHPDRFMRQITYLENHQEVDLLATACVTINQNNKVTGALPFLDTHSRICKRPWLGFYMPHPTWMGKIEWFKENPYLEPGPYCCEDNELLLRAYTFSTYHALPDKLLAYRIRERTPIIKSFRTRLSLGRVQVKQFYRNLNLFFLFLSLISTLVRLVKDLLSQMNMPKFLVKKKISNEAELDDDSTQWREIIDSIYRKY